MKVTILQRSVARIDRPTVQMGMTPEHRVVQQRTDGVVMVPLDLIPQRLLLSMQIVDTSRRTFGRACAGFSAELLAGKHFCLKM